MLLKEWRWSKKMTQNELADLLGVSQALVSLAEGGSVGSSFVSRFKEKLKDEAKKIDEFKVKK